MQKKVSAFEELDCIPAMVDMLGRSLRELRISVTDRCNFRCVYCMPKPVFGRDFVFVSHDEMLSFEEVFRLASLFVEMGVRKIRLTGGEPLMRKGVENLVALLSSLKTPGGHGVDLTMTTNGSMLARKASALFDAGLKRVTVSLDALDDLVFRMMNDVDFPVAAVLEGIDAAVDAGFFPVKVNMVVRKGMNVDQIIPVARYCREKGIIPRFIEYMDVGSTNRWNRKDVFSSDEIVAMVDAEMPLERIDVRVPGETAARWRFKDGQGEMGVIASVTQAFCQDCSRIRLSMTGQLYMCLFATQGLDLKALVRNNLPDEKIRTFLMHSWQSREDRYSALRHVGVPLAGKKIEMSYIGG